MPSPALHDHRGLVAFDAGAKLAIADGGELPGRIVVAPWGTHDTPKGQIVIGDRTAAVLAGNQRASQFDRVALDFNHNTVPGSESYRGEPAKVAAHGTPLMVPGEGIVLDALEWTPEGREFVGGRHYIDLSPTLQLDARGEAVFLHSAAVCRQGAIPGLTLTLFSADLLPPKLAALTAALTEKNNPMDPKKLLAALLGVDENATDATFEQAAQNFATEQKALSALGAKFTALSATVNQLTAFAGDGKTFKSFDELPAALSRVIGEVAALRGLHETAQREEIVREATRQGKAIPQAALEGEGRLSNEVLKSLCATLPVTVPLERRTVTLSADPAATTQSSEELQVFSALGVTKEQAAKYN